MFLILYIYFKNNQNFLIIHFNGSALDNDLVVIIIGKKYLSQLYNVKHFNPGSPATATS